MSEMGTPRGGGGTALCGQVAPGPAVYFPHAFAPRCPAGSSSSDHDKMGFRGVLSLKVRIILYVTRLASSGARPVPALL